MAVAYAPDSQSLRPQACESRRQPARLAGAGHGLAFLAAQDDLTRIAPDDRRAEISAAFYVCIYLGLSVPVIGGGVLAAVFSLFTAVAVFAAVTGTAALLTAAGHLRTPAERR